MKRFKVRYCETFLEDISEIVLHIFDKTGSQTIAKNFYSAFM